MSCSFSFNGYNLTNTVEKEVKRERKKNPHISAEVRAMESREAGEGQEKVKGVRTDGKVNQ